MLFSWEHNISYLLYESSHDSATFDLKLNRNANWLHFCVGRQFSLVGWGSFMGDRMRGEWGRYGRGVGV